MQQINRIIMERLGALERDNALLKSQVRALSVKSKDEVKAPLQVAIKQPEKITDNDIIKLIKSTITLTFVNKLYGKNNG
tara:strand:- start:463 stop:699 length:237 start_codon:yes stop_codon:yes gene_type:complete